MKAKQLLKELGVKPHLLGYIYILDWCEMGETNSKIIYEMTKTYDIIARKNNTTRSRVERAIRHLISSIEYASMKNGNEKYNSMFKYYDKRPKNSEFIGELYNELGYLYNNIDKHK